MLALCIPRQGHAGANQPPIKPISIAVSAAAGPSASSGTAVMRCQGCKPLVLGESHAADDMMRLVAKLSGIKLIYLIEYNPIFLGKFNLERLIGLRRSRGSILSCKTS